MKTKDRKETSVRLTYIIHIQEIKPWPPSHSLRLLRSVQIQWENGGKSSGSTNSVVPFIGSSVNDGKIEFNESFRIPVTLLRNMSIKAGDADLFQKNCVEFSLYEPRRDKTLKGQLLGTATLDLADYGVIREGLTINVPMNCQRNYKNAAQPLLYLKIQPVGKGHSSIASRNSLSKEAFQDRNGGESVLALMKEEYAEEAESNTFSDDDVSSSSSMAISSDSSGGLPPKHVQESNSVMDNERADAGLLSASATELKESDAIPSFASHEDIAGISSRSSSMDLSYVSGSLENGHAASASSPRSSTISIGRAVAHSAHSSFSSFTNDQGEEEPNAIVSSKQDLSSENKLDTKLVMESASIERLRHVKSVRSSSDDVRNCGAIINPLAEEVKESCSPGDAKNGSNLIRTNERKDTTTRSTLLEAKVQQMEHRIQMLEGELREVAAVEVALYSVVAEHGSSMSKLHAPARRLSRLYLHEDLLSRRATAAKSAISGLILVSKACGNDVQRLTYWLSNSVVLRAIISQAMTDKDLPSSSIAQNAGTFRGNSKISALKWESSPSKKRSEYSRTLDWEDPQTFISALQKVEAWIFSRTIESIWWQTFNGHMHCTRANPTDKTMLGSSKNNRKVTCADDRDHGSISLDLWKNAFKDAFERLCPIRAAGHECGCLPMLARLIMEQCVSRLDVAMFNAILRESADEIPTDPVSDPISDSAVLPIPPGKSSFGAGAQLKNAIGNWSRWLTDLFGVDEDDSEKNEDDNDIQDTLFKSFNLLNALSDVMMLPKDMLLCKSIRKEVCPVFGVSLIKRVLNTFVPDEFCPDPIPDVVLEALDAEDPLEAGTSSVTNYPYIAAPPIFIHPSPNSVARIIGDISTQNQLQRNRSSLIKKSHTSDDELDELDSPLALILPNEWTPKEIGNRQNTLRFGLLRHIWLNSD